MSNLYKKCHRCSKTKSVSDFGLSKKGRILDFCNKCREIKRAQHLLRSDDIKLRRQKPEAKDKRMHRYYLKKYGISLVEYEKLFLKQGGKCAICKTHQSELSSKLQVDHNHETTEVRGLLCFNCNSGIGSLRNKKNLIEAIKYLS